MTNRHKAYLALLSNAAIWGFALVFAKKGFEQTTPVVFLFYRYLFATLVSIPIVIIFYKKLKIRLRDIPELAMLAIFSTVLGHWLLYEGLNKTTALESSLITVVIPIFIIIGGAVFLKENITSTEKWGTTLAFLGSVLIIFEPFFRRIQSLSFTHSLGNLMVLGYNLSWTIAVLWMKKVAKKYPPFTIAYSSFIVGLIGFFILSYLENPDFLTQNYFSLPYAFGSSLYMGTLGSVVAYFAYQYGQQFIEASEATLFSYLTSLFALPLAIFWLKELPTTPVLIGGLIVVTGIFIAEKRWQKKSSKTRK